MNAVPTPVDFALSLQPPVVRDIMRSISRRLSDGMVNKKYVSRNGLRFTMIVANNFSSEDLVTVSRLLVAAGWHSARITALVHDGFALDVELEVNGPLWADLFI